MAALTGTLQGRRRPIGDRALVTVTASSAGNSDDYITAASIGLSWIDQIVGVARKGTTVGTDTPVLNKNTQSHGSAEGSSAGDLSFRTVTADTATYEITVIGIP